MVWKSTTQLGCGEALCPAGSRQGQTAPEYLVVCRYKVTGNFGTAADFLTNI